MASVSSLSHYLYAILFYLAFGCTVGNVRRKAVRTTCHLKHRLQQQTDLPAHSQGLAKCIVSSNVISFQYFSLHAQILEGCHGLVLRRFRFCLLQLPTFLRIQRSLNSQQHRKLRQIQLTRKVLRIIERAKEGEEMGKKDRVFLATSRIVHSRHPPCPGDVRVSCKSFSSDDQADMQAFVPSSHL